MRDEQKMTLMENVKMLKIRRHRLARICRCRLGCDCEDTLADTTGGLQRELGLELGSGEWPWHALLQGKAGREGQGPGANRVGSALTT